MKVKLAGPMVALGVVSVLALAACGSESDSEASTKTQTVKTVAGEVKVPVDPERVVTTHNIATQPIVDLGVKPVGIGEMQQIASYPSYWKKIEDLPQVSKGGETDIEKVAELDPDVIFATNMTPDTEVEKLQKIAPVVQIGIDGAQRTDWRGRTDLIADVLGRQKQADQLEAAYEKHAKQVATEHKDALAKNTVSVLDSFQNGEITPASGKSMVGTILTDAGARFAPSAKTERVRKVDSASGERQAIAVSAEYLADLADGDLVLHGSLPVGGESPTVKTMLANRLFTGTKAAKADQVYPIGKTTIAGYGDAEGTLDYFDKALSQVS